MARELLKATRKGLGLTQQQMADAINVSRVYYQMLELGTRVGPVDLWDKLEDLTGVSQRILREIQETHPDQAGNQ